MSIPPSTQELGDDVIRKLLRLNVHKESILLLNEIIDDVRDLTWHKPTEEELEQVNEERRIADLKQMELRANDQD